MQNVSAIKKQKKVPDLKKPEHAGAEFHVFENIDGLDLQEHDVSFRQGLIASKIAELLPEDIKFSLTAKTLNARKGKVILYRIKSTRDLKKSEVKELLEALS